MKNFSTLGELWNYCEYCSLCKNNRKIILNIGPDPYFKLIKYTKLESELILYCRFRNLQNLYCDIKYTISCKDNSVKSEYSENYVNEFLDKEFNSSIRNNIKYPYFYFYFNIICEKCDNTHLCTDDIELSKDYISNLRLDREGFHIRDGNNKYYICYNHIDNKTLILKEGNSRQLSINSIVEIDFSNINYINKVKTLLNFS
jgi:hypothetical protein